MLRDLKQIISIWREQSPDKPLSWFAVRAGIEYSTFHRIAGGEVTRPAYEIALAIGIASDLDMRNVEDFLLEQYPKKSKRIPSDLALAKRLAKIQNEKVVETLTKDEISWRVLTWVMCKPVQAKKLQTMGDAFLEVAKDLHNNGIIDLKDETYFYDQENTFIPSSMLLKTSEFFVKSLQQRQLANKVDPKGQLTHLFLALNNKQYDDLLNRVQSFVADLTPIVVDCDNVRNDDDNYAPVNLLLAMSRIDGEIE